MAHNCPTCGHGSDTVSEMIAHELKAHIQHRNKYGCGHCRVYFPMKLDLIEHKMTDCPLVSETIRKKNLEEKKKFDEKEREKIIDGIRSGKIPRKDIYLKKKREEEAMNKAFVVEEDSKTVSSDSAESGLLISITRIFSTGNFRYRTAFNQRFFQSLAENIKMKTSNNTSIYQSLSFTAIYPHSNLCKYNRIRQECF